MIVLPQSNSRHPVRCLAFSPDGQTLACAGGKDAGVALWDLTACEQYLALVQPYKVASVAFSPDGELLASVTSNGLLWVWSMKEPRDPQQWEKRWENWWWGGRAYAHAPSHVTFSPDGLLVATTLSDLHVRSGRRGVSLVPVVGGPIIQYQVGDAKEPTHLAWSPDGSLLAVGSFDRSVHVFNVEEHTRVSRLFQGQKVHYVAFSPDGKTLAAGNPRGLVKLWNATTGRKLRTLKGQAKPLRALCYSPDGKVIVTAGGEGVVTFWDVATGKSRMAFDWAVGEVLSVAFAPDGMRAAAGGVGRVVVWDVDGWEV